MNASLRRDEAKLIAEAHAAVLEQSRTNKFEPAPYEHATALLESLPPTEFVDDRVQLALDVTVATRFDHRPDLSRRALYAAFPADNNQLKDKRLRRKWFTFAGIIEANLGNVERSLRYKLIALELCEQLRDSFGFCAEWMNFANVASGAGLYQDAAEYATVAIEVRGNTDEPWLRVRGGALINRANALIRLGRFEEAASDLSLCLMCLTHPPSAQMRNQIIFAQYLFAEVQLEYGNRLAARAALDAASTWADASGVTQYKLQVERVRTRLSAFECGLGQAILRLEELLKKAHEIEDKMGATSFDDIVLDVLHTLERVCREHGYVDGASKWLNAIGEKLRNNANKVVDALADKPRLLIAETLVAAKMGEVDKYLQSRATSTPSTPLISDSTWTYVIGLAASASSVEDPSKEHGIRVARLAGLLARELDLPSATQRGIEGGCLVHDIGKVSIPASILMKQTALDIGEQYLYDAHPEVGTELLERVNHPEHSVVRNVIRFHHCPYTGGPEHSQPRGEAIPLEGRIASVCDEYDSLVSGRPRRQAISSNDALREIFEQRSGKFDPKVVDVFVEIVRHLQRTHPDLQAYLSEEADNMEYFAMQRTLKRAAERALTAPTS